MQRLIFAIISVGVFFVGAFLYFEQKPETSEITETEKESSIEEGNSTSTEVKKNQGNVISATIKTKKGNIELELYPDIAPKTVDNFIKLAKENFYDGIKFHRVIPGFVIQAGDPLSKTDDPRVGTGGPGYTFEDEINPKTLGLSDDEIAKLEAQGYKYNYELESIAVEVGTIAMANSGPATNGSQFFIVTEKDQPHLNGKHTVFGRVVKGMDVVKKIEEQDVMIDIKVAEN